MKAPIGQQRRVREAIKQEQLRKAAPAMLEALEALSRDYEKLSDNQGLNPNATTVYRNARAAIAAAKGEV